MNVSFALQVKLQYNYSCLQLNRVHESYERQPSKLPNCLQLLLPRNEKQNPADLDFIGKPLISSVHYNSQAIIHI